LPCKDSTDSRGSSQFKGPEKPYRQLLDRHEGLDVGRDVWRGNSVWLGNSLMKLAAGGGLATKEKPLRLSSWFKKRKSEGCGAKKDTHDCASPTPSHYTFPLTLPNHITLLQYYRLLSEHWGTAMSLCILYKESCPLSLCNDINKLHRDTGTDSCPLVFLMISIGCVITYHL
jgi:hypothetical protein